MEIDGGGDNFQAQIVLMLAEEADSAGSSNLDHVHSFLSYRSLVVSGQGKARPLVLIFIIMDLILFVFNNVYEHFSLYTLPA